MTWWSIATSTWWCNAQRQIKRCRRSSASRLFSFLKSSQADTKVSSDGRRKSTFLQWTDCCFLFILEYTGLLPQHWWKKRRSFIWIRWAVRMRIAESSFSSTCESSMKVRTDIVNNVTNFFFRSEEKLGASSRLDNRVLVAWGPAARQRKRLRSFHLQVWRLSFSRLHEVQLRS